MRKITLFCAILASALFSANIEFDNADDDYVRKSPNGDKNIVLSFHDSISVAKESVVNISTSKTIKNQVLNPFNDPIIEQFFGFKFNIPESKQKATSLGSGVVISNDGYIVTNNHVVEGSDEILVTTLDSSKEYKAKIVGADSKTDIAIIKVEATNLKSIKFADSSKVLEGDIVFAIGNPFGVGGSISQGIISGLNKDNIGLNQYEDFIQTDASINPGNSGGALVDSRGALVGINSAILSRSGGNNGIGFAIPSNMVKQIAQKLIVHGKITRGYLGVNIGNLNSDQKEFYVSSDGALVINIEEGGPADKGGLKRGDLITKVNNKSIKNANDLKNFIGSLEPNTKVVVEYERTKEIKTTELTLTNMDNPNNYSDDTTEISGLVLSNTTDKIKNKFKIAKNVNGVVITDIKKDSKIKASGFEVGDVIIQVNSKTISNISEFKKEIENSKKMGKKAMIWINRNNMIMGLVLRLG